MSRIKEIEKYYFECFSKNYPLPSGKIIHDDKPDFMIVGEQTLGIELSRLFLASGNDKESTQVQNAQRKSVLRKASDTYFEDGVAGLELLVGFNGSCPIRDIGHTAQELVILARSLEGHLGGRVDETQFQHIEPISSIWLNWVEDVNPSWRLFQSGSVPLLSQDRVLSEIRRKEQVLPSYTSCDEYWLLLTINMIDTAQEQDLPREEDLDPIPTKFARVYLFKPQMPEILSVPTQ